MKRKLLPFVIALIAGVVLGTIGSLADWSDAAIVAAGAVVAVVGGAVGASYAFPSRPRRADHGDGTVIVVIEEVHGFHRISSGVEPAHTRTYIADRWPTPQPIPVPLDNGVVTP